MLLHNSQHNLVCLFCRFSPMYPDAILRQLVFEQFQQLRKFVDGMGANCRTLPAQALPIGLIGQRGSSVVSESVDHVFCIDLDFTLSKRMLNVFAKFSCHGAVHLFCPREISQYADE